MIEFICLFCPSFISLAIYIKYFKNKNKTEIINSICYYFFSVLANYFVVNAILYFIFKRNEVIYTLQFSEKYILMSTIIAVHIPMLFNYLNKCIDKLLTKYFDFIRKASRNLKNKIIKSRNIKKIINCYKKNGKSIIRNLIYITLIIIQFLFFDLIIRTIIHNQINFYGVHMLTPNIITIAYGLMIGLILLVLSKMLRNIFTIFIYAFNTTLFVVNYMLLLIKSEAFTIYDFQIASEGFEYANFIVDEITPKFIVIILLSILLFILTLIYLKKVKCELKIRKKIIIAIVSIIAFFCLKFTGIAILDDYVNAGGWEDITYPKYYTDHLINSRKNISVLGMYEYTLKDIINYYENQNKKYGSEEQIQEIIKSNHIEKTQNELTGKFKDKNLIMIMMESIDRIIIDEETMPTLSRLMNEGWNFNRRYNQLNSSGSTIATEYTTLSGLYHIGDNRYDVNDYNESIPSIFVKNNYQVSSFHENYGIYYNRSELHRSLGFENSYFLSDMNIKIGYDDAQFFENDELYNLVVPKKSDKKFMSFITTISAHGPYTNNGLCKMENITNENECLRYLSKKTDNMIDSMLRRLKEDNLLDDTIIILYSDHAAYSYNYTEEELNNTYEQINGNYDIKNLPFIIYGTNIEPEQYNDIIVNDIDFAPTIFNLFGFDYIPNEYVGTDIFSTNHKNICIFRDYTWFDGKMHSGNALVDDDYIEISSYVKERIEFNRMLISHNYYKKYNN